MDLLSIGLSNSWLAGMGLIGAVYFLGYFILNFNVVGIGTFTTVPFEMFIVSWIIMPIGLSFFLIIKYKGRW